MDNGEIEVVGRDVVEAEPLWDFGTFPPSQVNALLGIVRNSTAYDGENALVFVGYQWLVSDGRKARLELIFDYD